VEPEKGDFTRPNPNSAAIWHYGAEFDAKGKEIKREFGDTMHRTLGSVAIKDDILYIADYSGLFHCLDAKTGKRHWVYDMLAASWGSPLIVDGKVYIGDEDGEVAIFKHSADPNVAMKKVGGEMKPFYGEMNMGNSVYSTPIVADNVLYIANRTHLFAIENGAKPVEANPPAPAQKAGAAKANSAD
jgi:outer membrane protein assembly factor BamB